MLNRRTSGYAGTTAAKWRMGRRSDREATSTRLGRTANGKNESLSKMLLPSEEIAKKYSHKKLVALNDLDEGPAILSLRGIPFRSRHSDHDADSEAHCPNVKLRTVAGSSIPPWDSQLQRDE